MSKRVTEIQAEHFDPDVLNLYWQFLAERQMIWLRRSRGMEAPWTADPILQVEFITNVYRQLDPGTEYLVDSILSAKASDEDKVFNVMLYRLMGSVPSTHQHIGFIKSKGFKAERLIEPLRALPDDYRIFGDAYRVASYMAEGGDNKIDNVATMFAYIAGGIDETVRRIKSSRRVVEVYKVFEQMQGFGEFLAHQIVVDLLYPAVDGSKIIPFDDNEFAKAGPGARKGIWDLINEQVAKPANLTIVLEWLRDNQQQAFEDLGIQFPYLLDPNALTLKPMSICDIQASLCEFHKYYRLWSGEKKVNVRKYDGPHRTVNPRDVVLSEDVIESLLPVNIPYTATGDETAAEVVERISDGDDTPPQDSLEPVKQDGFGYEVPAMTFTSPDGKVVNIHITINVG